MFLKRNLPRLLTRVPNEGFYANLLKLIEPVMRDRLLDLGCGAKPRNDFAALKSSGVDFVGNELLDVAGGDLALNPIPFEDESFSIATAYDFLEHIPRVRVGDGRTFFPFVDLMSEVHRILRPGGYFFALTPAFPAAEAFQDPTHVNIITKKTFRLYFCGPNPWATKYGFSGSFDVVKEGWRKTHYFVLLRKR